MNVKKTVRTVGMVVIFTLIIISFAFWGMNKNMLTGVQGNTVIASGSHTVDRVDFKREFDQVKQQAEQEQKHPVSVEELVGAGIVDNLVQQLSQRTAISVVLDRLGVRPGLEMMAEEMRKIPDFFDPVSGRFDRASYLKVLSENNLTDNKFKDVMSDQIAFRHMYTAVEAGLRPPTILAAYQSLMVRQKRDVSVLYVTPAMVGAVAPPTDAQLTAFMNENAQQIRAPETKILTIVRFKAADVAASVTVSEADIQKIIDFRKDQQTTPETRTIVQIAAKDRATAQTIATRLSQGQEPDVVARAVGSAAVPLENKPKTAIPDAKTADAAFALAEGANSGPIEGGLGFTVIKVIAVTPAKQPNPADLRKAAEAEAHNRAAQMKITEQSNKFEDALNAGKDMAEAAKSVGATVLVTPPIAANGSAKDGRPPAGVSPRLMQEVSQLQANEKSDIVQESPTEYFIVRVDRVIPPAMPPLAEVRDKLVPVWIARQTQDRLKVKTEELAAKLRQGGVLADVAREAGGTVVHITDLNVHDGQTLAQTYGEPLVRGAISAKKGEYFTGEAPPAAGQTAASLRQFVATLDQIRQPDTATLAPEGQQAMAQIGQATGSELEEQVLRSAGGLIAVKSYPDRARLALGLEPVAPAAPAGKAGVKAAAKK